MKFVANKDEEGGGRVARYRLKIDCVSLGALVPCLLGFIILAMDARRSPRRRGLVT